MELVKPLENIEIAIDKILDHLKEIETLMRIEILKKEDK